MSDNASTDRTAEICLKYARQDKRIRYSRNPENIGGANNENLTFRKSRGEYFRWAAHDDICAPTLLEKCVHALNEHPEAPLCHTNVVDIDEDGTPLQTVSQPEPPAQVRSPAFASCRGRIRTTRGTYGLIRSDMLRRTRLQLNYTNSDRVLLCELALRGPFVQIPEPLFFKRYHSGNQYKDWRGRMAWFLPDLQRTGAIACPHWMEFFDYITTIRRVPLAPRQRLLCYGWLLGPWLAKRSRNLAGDVLHAAIMATSFRDRRRQRYRNEQKWL